jgi:ABC-type multidrug transport system fused ATPase/permease subunit
VINYPVSFFKDQSLGKITYSLNTGINILSSAVLNSLESFGMPLMTIFNIFFLFYLSVKIGFVVLVGSLFYGL